MGLARLARRIRLIGVANDEGFTLIEAMVSLLVLALIFTGLASALGSSVKATLLGRDNQQARDAVTKQVEYVRSLSFAAAVMVSSDSTLNSTSDPNIVGTCTTTLGSCTYNGESLVVKSTGSINPHVQTFSGASWNNTPFTVKTYVTQPSDSVVSGAGVYYRRLTVVASWKVFGQTHTRTDTTMLSWTLRGLPLPFFKWQSSTPTQTVNAGASASFALKLNNQGAPDTFNITVSGAPTGYTWTWYQDANCDGVAQAGDPTLTDSNGDGTVDTGLMQTGMTQCIVAATTTNTVEGTFNVVFTATSVAQPSATGGTESVTDKLIIAPPAGSCASGESCTVKTYYLHNAVPNSGNTVAQGPMPSDANTPTATTLYEYSTDLSTDAGRYVKAGASGSGETDVTKVADWRYQIPTATGALYNGTAEVTLSAVLASKSLTAPMTVNIYIGSGQNSNMSSFTLAGSGSYTLNPWGSASFQTFTVSIPISNLSIAKNKYLVIRAEVGTSSDMELAYDTTTYASNASMPCAPTYTC